VLEHEYDWCHSSDDDDSIQQQLDTAFCHLPCAQLRELRVEGLGLEVQLAPARGRLGLLHDCTHLTALELRYCMVRNVSAATAAITALAELKDLCLGQRYGRLDYAGWQHHLKLTCLSLRLRRTGYDSPTPHQDLCQLSALVNLQHLQLIGLKELPGGVPSALAKLTCLTIQYPTGAPYVPGQFQHLGSLTKPEVLEVFGYAQDMTRDLHGIQQLPALTKLHICKCDVTNSAAYTHNWTRKTMLRGLALTACAMQPEALAAFTQLRLLRWNNAILSEGASYDQLLEAMAQLTQLEELSMHDRANDGAIQKLPAAAFTAFTASTDLRVLQLGLPWGSHLAGVVEDCVLFTPGSVYPHLRQIDLQYEIGFSKLMNKQRLQDLCSSCPALDSLAFELHFPPPQHACLCYSCQR
jgi:hypothetical protein